MSGDTTLTTLLGTPPSGWTQSIFHHAAPPNARFPFVVFSRSSEIPTYANVTTPALDTEVWLVKAMDGPRQGATDPSFSADPAGEIAARLDTLLNDAPLSLSGGTVVYLRHQSAVDYLEDTDGKRYVHLGALYRLVYEPN